MTQPSGSTGGTTSAFAAGLVLVAAALHPEMDHLAHQWFWLHMVQNDSLSLVVSLLLVLGITGLGAGVAALASARCQPVVPPTLGSRADLYGLILSLADPADL